MSRHSIAALGVILAAATASVTAAEYSVQVAVLKNSNEAYLAPAREVGTVSGHEGGGGLTRYLVGTYATREAALKALRALRAAGYSDAFLTSESQRTTMAATATSTAKERDVYSGIPPELEDRVVYLDGVLHVKEGDEFTPLDEWKP